MALLMKKNNQLVSVGCSVKTGSSTPIVDEKDVNFYDYDGTLLYAYTKTEFLALSDLPANPSHTGLIAQGWNWSLSDAKTYVTNYDVLNIGQNYTTVSGMSEFYIELNRVTGLSVTLNMDGNKDWGDGTTNNSTTHTYSNYGQYTIKCNGTNMSTSSSSGLFGQTQSTYNYSLKCAYIANVTAITSFSFRGCQSLINITINSSILNLESYAFENCKNLKSIILPENLITIGNYALQYCSNILLISLGKNITNIPMYMLAYCYKLKRINIPPLVESIGTTAFATCVNCVKTTMPDSVTSIDSTVFLNNTFTNIIFGSGVISIGTNAFNNCCSVLCYDFSKATSVPTLYNTNAFTGINAFCKIIVPDNLYSQWKTATNWSTYSSYIYKASEVTL